MHWEQTESRFKVVQGAHPLVDIFIASEEHPDADYHYGGTRLVGDSLSDTEAKGILKHLAFYESGVKNRLINLAFAEGALAGLESRLPRGLAQSKVAGGRCVLRPTSPEATRLLGDTSHPQFEVAIDSILRDVGGLLNQHQGRIKLTPDFGRYAFLADVLKRHTPHSLGIRCEDGGCGGKSSYTTTGIIEAVEHLCGRSYGGPLTLIGSAGALGTDFLRYAVRRCIDDFAISDVAYDEAAEMRKVEGLNVLPAQLGKFLPECLSRGGIVVATTVGHELENSDWKKLPAGTKLFLAHNSAFPEGEKGIALAQALAAQGVHAIPGPVLTLGGALTSRVEWFWRQSRSGEPFDKPLAHEVVKRVTALLLTRMEAIEKRDGVTPLEAMFALIEEGQAATTSTNVGQ